MKNSSRRAIAAAVAAVMNDQCVSHVYDYAAGKHFSHSAQHSSGTVSGYDYERGAHVSGGLNADTLSLYDYGRSAHMSVTLNGNQFSGYDYHTSSHFSGSVSGASITIYDHETGQHYNYSV